MVDDRSSYQKFTTPHFDIFYKTDTGLSHIFFFHLRKKYLNAVERNRVKRVFRERFRNQTFCRIYKMKIYLRIRMDLSDKKELHSEIDTLFSRLS